MNIDEKDESDLKKDTDSVIESLITELENEVNDEVKNDPITDTNRPRISFEGSTVLCVLISLKKNISVKLKSLPEVDRKVILECIKTINGNGYSIESFNVSFDEKMNFQLIIKCHRLLEILKGHPQLEIFTTSINLINSIITPSKDDIKDAIQECNSPRMRKLAGIDEDIFLKKKSSNILRREEKNNSITKSGKNAYEIRADILSMAIDFLKFKGESLDKNYVMETAKEFYSFVENKK